jgi:hypothetical protein
VEVKNFVHSAIDKFMSLFEYNSKEKYANLYLAWLEYIRTFTCRSKQTLATLATMARISPDTQRTVIARILHAVQDGIQSQMATNIETFDAECSMTEVLADDTALYSISGWALTSCIDNTKEFLKTNKTSTQFQQHFELLLALKRPNSNSAKGSLPTGVERFFDMNMTILDFDLTY